MFCLGMSIQKSNIISVRILLYPLPFTTWRFSGEVWEKHLLMDTSIGSVGQNVQLASQQLWVPAKVLWHLQPFYHKLHCRGWEFLHVKVSSVMSLLLMWAYMACQVDFVGRRVYNCIKLWMTFLPYQLALFLPAVYSWMIKPCQEAW